MKRCAAGVRSVLTLVTLAADLTVFMPGLPTLISKIS